MSEQLSSQVLITPFPDGETVNSLLRRNARLAGDSTLRKISRQLLARCPALDGMPSRLDEFHARVGYLFGDRDELEAKHTLLAYELLGVPPERHNALKERLRTSCKGPIRSSRLPVLLAPSEAAFLVCPECEEAALDQYGFSFTHRRDVAPFVAACPVHFCWLRPSAKREHLFDAQCHCTRSMLHLRNAIQFAMYSDVCVAGVQSACAYSKAGVIDALRKAHWLLDSGRLRLAELVTTFMSFYSERFDDCRLDALVSTPEYIEAALRALTREGRAIHAVWCILLTWFAQHCECQRPCSPLRGRREVRSLSAAQVKAALSLYGSVVSAAHALGTSAHRLTIVCRCSGIPVDARPSRLDDATLTTIRQRLASGMRPQEVACATEMSTNTVYRVLAAMPFVESHYRTLVTHSTNDAKLLWLRLHQDHPKATQTQLRHIAPATFAVLHRNAREWLQHHTRHSAPMHAPGHAPRPSSALSALARAVNAAVAHLDLLDDPPVRRSVYRLRELLGINEYALKSSASDSLLRGFSQTRDAYIAARLDWAIRHGASARLYDWRTARAANLRQTTLKNWGARRQDEAEKTIDGHSKFVSRNGNQG